MMSVISFSACAILWQFWPMQENTNIALTPVQGMVDHFDYVPLLVQEQGIFVGIGGATWRRFVGCGVRTHTVREMTTSASEFQRPSFGKDPSCERELFLARHSECEEDCGRGWEETVSMVTVISVHKMATSAQMVGKPRELARQRGRKRSVWSYCS